MTRTRGMAVGVCSAILRIGALAALGAGPASAQLGTTAVWSSVETERTTSVAWGDHDGDGDLDLAAGNDGSPVRVYANAGGFLALAWTAAETDATWSVAWGDYDGDGDIDLATGHRGGPNRVYRNDAGTLALAWSSTETDDTLSVAWGDYDGDDDLDLAAGNAGQPNRLYRNDAGTLTLAWSSPVARPTTSVAWGDWDGDGDPDLAVGNAGASEEVYRNDLGTLVLAWSAGDTDDTQSVAWGDLDGDGDLDLAVGNAGADHVYRNDGAATMVLAWSSSATGDFGSSVAWGDWDCDGDLDLAASNVAGGAGEPVRVYANDAGALTEVFASTEDDSSLDVAWGDWDGDGDLDLAVGTPAGFPIRVYRAGGPDFVLAWTAPIVEMTRDLAWGDWDGDGDLDFATASEQAPARIYENAGGTFTEAWSSLETPFYSNSVAWGDADGDGDLDLAVANETPDPIRLYRNDGGGAMSVSWEESGPEYNAPKGLAWGDADLDGDLDLAVANQGSSVGFENRLYLNDGVGSLALGWTAPVASESVEADWGDWDNDGDLDLVTVGQYDLTFVYRNDGGASFTTVWSDWAPDFGSSIAWGDYDADGDLDLAYGNHYRPTRVYRNDGGTFSLFWQTAPIGGTLDHTWGVAWGDYDGDGDLDLAMANDSEPDRLYENDGSTFVLRWSSPEDDFSFDVAWGDWDGDGDPDLAFANWCLVGFNCEPTRIYRNVHVRANPGLPETTTYPAMPLRPGTTPSAAFHSTPEILTSPVAVPYTLYDAEGDRAARIVAEYSPDQGGYWLPATEGPGGDGTVDLAASPGGTPHVFSWDVEADLAWGDDLRFRIGVLQQTPDRVGDPVQLPMLVAESPLFRVHDLDCDPPRLTPRTGLLAWKEPPGGSAGGIRFRWSADPLALEHHVNSVEFKTDLVSPGPYRPPVVGGVGIARCEALSPGSSCLDPAPIPGPPDRLFFQVVSACGPDGSTEGPVD